MDSLIALRRADDEGWVVTLRQGLIEIVRQQQPLPPGLDVIPHETEIEVLSRGVTIGFIDKYLMLEVARDHAAQQN